MVYKIYTTVNYADTSRDRDDICTNVLCYSKNKKVAFAYCIKYIKDHFIDKTRVMSKTENRYTAIDTGSYAVRLVAEEIRIDG